MNFKNASILTIFLISSLELLNSCSNKATESKPGSLSRSYKLVDISCGKIHSTFTPEGYNPTTDTSNRFTFTSSYVGDLSANRDFKLKYENGKYSFVYSEMKNNTKCSYSEELVNTVSSSNANIIRLENYSTPIIIPSTANDSKCRQLSFSPFGKLYFVGEYTFTKNNSQLTLTSETNIYCKDTVKIMDTELILTFEKE